MNRYVRQISVPEFGKDRQLLLSKACVLVIGAGGLASPVLQYLVGAGVGHIRLVDPDLVEISNLHRQTLFREADIGQSKASVSAAHMSRLNSDCHIDALVARFDPDTAAAFCNNVNLVLDCADSFAVSYIASDYCLTAGIPFVTASVIGTSGYCGGFCGKAPGLRAVFPNLPESLGSCDSDGVLGPSVGVIGSLQAQMALAVLCEIEPSPLGKLVTYDALKYRFGGFRFDEAKNPKPKPNFITANAIKYDDFLVDLRAQDELGPKLNNAQRFSVADFIVNVPNPNINQRAVLACGSGLRAWQAAEQLSITWPGEIVLIALGNN